MNEYALTLLVVTLFMWSFMLRVDLIRNNHQEKIQVKPSPISLALQETIAVAGGIYLSLIMFISFLKLNLQEIVLIKEIHFDPLAALSIFLTTIQPITVKFTQYFFRR